MEKLLRVSAIVEITAGIGLLAIPALLASLLLGSALDSAAGLAVARVAGAALVSLGVACWLGWQAATRRAVPLEVLSSACWSTIFLLLW